MLKSKHLPQEQDLFPYQTTMPGAGKVLVLAPHPDDETLGCGGAIQLHMQRQDTVRIIFLTDGGRGDFEGRYKGQNYRKIRKNEAIAAAKHLGSPDLEFWDFPDRDIDLSALQDRLESILLNFRPDLVYVTSPLELNPDHRAAAYGLWKALEVTGINTQVAFYEVSTPIIPNVLIDITEVMSKKEAATRVYESQMHVVDYFEIVEALNRFRSLTVSGSIKYAEAFLILKTEDMLGAKLGNIFPRIKRFLGMEKMDPPELSVIVRTKDRPQLLRQALSSLKQQLFQKFEVIIVNDGGVEIREILDEFKNQLNIKYLSNRTSLGRSKTGNIGLQAAAGRYITFLDDDDILYPRHLQVLVEHINKNEGIGLVYSDCHIASYEWNDENELQLRSAGKRLFKGRDFDREKLYQSNYIPIMTALFKRELLQDVGYLDDRLDVFEDWDLWIRLAGVTDFLRVSEATCEYRIVGTRQYNYLQGQLVIYDKHKHLYGPDDFKRWLHQMQVENDLLKMEIDRLRNRKE